MIKQITLVGIVLTGTQYANALDVPITASVTGSCIISTETNGTYGQPNAYLQNRTPF